MNTSDFIDSIINKDKLIYYITNFFDEIMVLYNIVGSKSDLTIGLNTDTDDSQISFKLTMASAEDAKTLMESVNASCFYVYETRYDIFMTRNRNIIDTTIVKAVSI